MKIWSHRNVEQFVLIGCVLVSLLALIAPQIFSVVFSPNDLGLSISGADEFVYLKMPELALRRHSYMGQYLEWEQTGKADITLFASPNQWLNYILGHLQFALALNMFELGLSLDVLSLLLSMVFLLNLIRMSGSSGPPVALAIVFALVLPKTMSIPFDVMFGPWGVKIVSAMPSAYRDVPVLRGIYTQLSFVFVLAISFLYFRSLFVRSRDRSNAILIGALAGLTYYFYFFAWACLLCTIVSSYFVRLLVHHKFKSVFDIYDFIVTVLVCFLISSPGIYQTFSSSASRGLGTASFIGQNWLLPITPLVIFATTIIWMNSQRSTRAGMILCFIIMSFACAEIITPNLQPIMGVFLSPQHFRNYFLGPVLSGLCAVFLFNVDWGLLRLWFSRESLLFSGWVALISITFVCIALSCQQFQTALKSVPNRSVLAYDGEKFRELAEVIHYLESNSEFGDVVSYMGYTKNRRNFPLSMGFEPSLVPSIVYSTTDRHVLLSLWVVEGNLQDELDRQLLTYYLEMGELPSTEICENYSVQSKDSLFYSTGVSLEVRNRKKCQLYSSKIHDFNICELMGKFKVDLILHEGGLSSSPKSFAEFSTLLMHSKHSSYKLYRFDRTSFIKRICKVDS